MRPPTAEETATLAADVALLRAAALHARQVWPGRLGDACAEWLIGEANCHEAVPDAMAGVAALVDSLAGEDVPTQMGVAISTLGAAREFALAVLEEARCSA